MPRPPGLPKTGGRRRGTPNKISSEFRVLVRDDTDDFNLLRMVAKGHKVGGHQPTIDQILKANDILIGKVMPSLKSSELQAEVNSQDDFGRVGIEETMALLAEVLELEDERERWIDGTPGISGSRTGGFFERSGMETGCGI